MGNVMKKLTTNLYTFEKLIDGGYLYVDKTEYVWKLVKEPYGIYFLSRPRRFGKSLTLSTLKAVFQGKKHLFEGLALESKPHEWKEYPIIHLDLGSKDVQNVAELRTYLTNRVNKVARDYDITLSVEACDERFQELIETLGRQDEVVILIDEYDKPILDNATAEGIEGIRRTMQSFYSVIKATEPYQRFVFMTGVSKFSKVSVFSKLNNMTDISMDRRYATMLGYTQEELESCFAEHFDRVVQDQGIDRNEILAKLEKWYNGYKFHQNAEAVYNPVSVGKFFESNGEFKNYWFETGTPSFLLKLAREQQFDFETELKRPVSELAFSSYEVGRLKILPLLLQTGYLTLKGSHIRRDQTLYELGFPNREVEGAFEAYLLEEYSGVERQEVGIYAIELSDMLEAGDVDGVMQEMRKFFVNIPYDIQMPSEKYYQTIFYVIFRLIGLFIEAEARTNTGRIDAVVWTDEYVYVFEFKLDGSPEEALRQIHEKEYHHKYLDSGQQIILVGANFSTQDRNIESWQVETIDGETSG